MDEAGPVQEWAGHGGRARAPRNRIGRALQSFWDTLLPPRCHACHGPIDGHAALCGGCWSEIRFIHPPVCDRLGTPLPYDLGHGAVSGEAIANPPDFDRARAAIVYAGTGRRLVHLFKYSDRLELRIILARWLAGAGAELLAGADLVVPVPLHARRLIWRRYNQAEFLARQIVPRGARAVVACDVLVRRRRTTPQVGLTESQRRDNVTGAFAVPARARARIAGRRILLVDDVITTGATVNACARTLKRAGAASVDVLAVALVDARFEGPR
jgi:ComF family protein